MKPIAIIVALGAVAVGTIAQAADPSLVGTWTGERQRIAKGEGLRSGLATLVITEQQGRTFAGHLTNTDGDVDEEGNYSFSLVDENTLDYCYTEAGPSARAVCARLTRQR